MTEHNKKEERKKTDFHVTEVSEEDLNDVAGGGCEGCDGCGTCMAMM